jgi:hypothetical protein
MILVLVSNATSGPITVHLESRTPLCASFLEGFEAIVAAGARCGVVVSLESEPSLTLTSRGARGERRWLRLREGRPLFLPAADLEQRTTSRHSNSDKMFELRVSFLGETSDLRFTHRGEELKEETSTLHRALNLVNCLCHRRYSILRGLLQGLCVSHSSLPQISLPNRFTLLAVDDVTLRNLGLTSAEAQVEILQSLFVTDAVFFSVGPEDGRSKEIELRLLSGRSGTVRLTNDLTRSEGTRIEFRLPLQDLGDDHAGNMTQLMGSSATPCRLEERFQILYEVCSEEAPVS